MEDDIKITENFEKYLITEIEKKINKKELSDRGRIFSIILYNDTESYEIENVLENIRSYKKYAYILHNKDTNEKNEPIKEHYHVVIKTENATTISALSKKLEIPKNYIEFVKNERKMIRYLIHLDTPKKYQYNFDEIHFNQVYSREVKKCFNDLESEEQIICNIRNFIESLHGKVSNNASATFMLIQYINSNCYDTIYKRYRQEFTQLLNYYL